MKTGLLIGLVITAAGGLSSQVLAQPTTDIGPCVDSFCSTPEEYTSVNEEANDIEYYSHFVSDPDVVVMQSRTDPCCVDATGCTPFDADPHSNDACDWLYDDGTPVYCTTGVKECDPCSNPGDCSDCGCGGNSVACCRKPPGCPQGLCCDAPQPASSGCQNCKASEQCLGCSGTWEFHEGSGNYWCNGTPVD